MLKLIGECLLCGGKKKPEHLVCSGCYQKFIKASGDALGKEGRHVLFSDWLRERGEETLPQLKAEYRALKGKYANLREEVNRKAYLSLKADLRDKQVDSQIFRRALDVRQDILWTEAQGNRLCWQVKSLEARIKTFEAFLGQQTVAEEIEKALAEVFSSTPASTSKPAEIKSGLPAPVLLIE